jgi:hypothetical protein
MNNYVKMFLDRKFAVEEEETNEFVRFVDLLKNERVCWNSGSELPGPYMGYDGRYIAAAYHDKRIYHNTKSQIGTDYPNITFVKASDIFEHDKQPDFSDFDSVFEE